MDCVVTAYKPANFTERPEKEGNLGYLLVDNLLGNCCLAIGCINLKNRAERADQKRSRLLFWERQIAFHVCTLSMDAATLMRRSM